MSEPTVWHRVNKTWEPKSRLEAMSLRQLIELMPETFFADLLRRKFYEYDAGEHLKFSKEAQFTIEEMTAEAQAATDLIEELRKQISSLQETIRGITHVR